MSYLTSILSLPSIQDIIFWLAVGLVTYWWLHKRRFKLPPGPFALPIVGNMMQMSSRYHEDFFEWSKIYGPVLTVHLGHIRTVVVNDIKSVNEVLLKRGADFADRISTHSFDIFSSGGKNIIFGQYGATWRLHRKISSKALRRYMQGEELEKRVHTAVDMVTELFLREAEPFDPKRHLSSMLFNILCAICFGTSYELDDPKMQKSMKALDNIASLNGSLFFVEDFIPPLRKCPTRTYKKFLQSVDELIHEFVGKEFYRHVENYDPENLRDFTDLLIQARKAAEDESDESILESLTDDHLIHSLNDIFFAGINTTKATLRWVFLYLAAYPDVQEKIQQEVDRVVGRDRLPRLCDRPNLPYTEAFLCEAMRLSTVAPIGVPHRAACDTKIGEYDIPKGTMVIINHWALHHDPKNWDDVYKFKPDRYLTKDGGLGSKPDQWLPFSAGPRVCLGESVAKPELHLLLASLMQRFIVRLPEGAQADFTPLNGINVNYPKDYVLVIKPIH